MRWYKPQYGDTRIVWKFLYFPARVGREVRWLEYAIIGQQYIGGHLDWLNTEFLSIKDIK
jgi:hypothetical protein